jgi:predicted transcriptional regulator
LERTRVLLDAAPKSLRDSDISKATGVSKAWISRFKSGGIPNPGINHVQAIYDYLANRV